ncbi:MAG TPA: DUF1735 domain-containing protein [Puia sp.]
MNKRSLLVICMAALLAGSCFKSNERNPLKGVPNPIVLFANSNWPLKSTSTFFNPFSTLTDSVAGTMMLRLRIQLSGMTQKTDTRVTLKVDTAQLLSYNAYYKTAYILLPDSCYTVGLTPMIPADTGMVVAVVSLSPSKFKGPSKYLLPLTIADAGAVPVAANAATMLYTLQGN